MVNWVQLGIATVDMRGLSTGAYVVKVTNEKQTDEAKIVLQN